MRRASRSAALMVALAMLTAACVSQDGPGVAIDARDADLVFGVKLEEDSAPTPQQALTRTPPLSLPDFSFEEPEPFTIPDLGPGVTGPCPEAAPTAVPEEITEAFVTGMPREGVYQWTGRRETIDENTGAIVDTDDLPIHRRILRNVEEISETRFTYETVQPIFEGEGAFLVSTWEVETGAETVSLPPEAGPVQGQIGTPPRVGEPEGGLLLVKAEVQDRNGQAVSGVQAFQPSVGLMFLPLPINPGQQFQSTAVDPRSGQTVVVDGITQSRARVDACGEVMDGWRVTGTQVVTSPAGPEVIEFDMIVATQFGAFIIEEYAQSGGVAVLTRAGQVDPDPLPEDQG